MACPEPWVRGLPRRMRRVMLQGNFIERIGMKAETQFESEQVHSSLYEVISYLL